MTIPFFILLAWCLLPLFIPVVIGGNPFHWPVRGALRPGSHPSGRGQMRGWPVASFGRWQNPFHAGARANAARLTGRQVAALLNMASEVNATGGHSFQKETGI